MVLQIENILAKHNGANVFSKIDRCEGYQKHEDSRNITTFTTHEQISHFKRLTYRVNSSFDCFPKQIGKVLTGLKSEKSISDNILICVNHKQIMTEIWVKYKKTKDSGLKINLAKWGFSVNKITFRGHVLSKNRISPDPTKKSSIENIKQRANVIKLNYSWEWSTFATSFSQTTEIPLLYFISSKRKTRPSCGPQQHLLNSKISSNLCK